MEILVQEVGTGKEASLQITINDAPHLQFLLKDYIGFQSWIEPTDKYQFKIQYTFKTDTVILSEYDTRDKWLTILKHIKYIL